MVYSLQILVLDLGVGVSLVVSGFNNTREHAFGPEQCIMKKSLAVGISIIITIPNWPQNLR